MRELNVDLNLCLKVKDGESETDAKDRLYQLLEGIRNIEKGFDWLEPCQCEINLKRKFFKQLDVNTNLYLQLKDGESKDQAKDRLHRLLESIRMYNEGFDWSEFWKFEVQDN